MFAPYAPTPTFQAKYVSTHKRAQIVRVLLIAGIVICVISLLFSVVQYAFPELVDFEQETPSLPTIVTALLLLGLALLELGVFIATMVFFLMWLYRSYENLLAFGIRPRDLEYGSGWAVGSFFIPILFLIIPHRGVRELWRKSVPNHTNMFSEISPPVFFPLWWAAWLLSNLLGWIYLRTMFQELTPDVEITLGVAEAVLSILAAVFASMVVSEIDKQQIASAELIGSMSQPQQPPLPPLHFEPVTPT